MATEIKQHIYITSKNPLDARVSNRNLKAYIVAEIARVDGVEATAKLYDLSMGTVYAALSFYEDNREAIQQALDDVRALDLGDMEVSENRIDEIRRKLADSQNK